MITELKPTNLIAVEFPAHYFYISLTQYFITENKFISVEDFLKGKISAQERCKVLGEVTKDKIGFDVEPYVDNELKSVGYVWMDYTLYDFEATNKGKVVVYKEKRPYKFDEAKDSFYSLLAANGLYFENPINKKEINVPSNGFADDNLTLEEVAEEWQSYENNLIKGKLLILEKC